MDSKPSWPYRQQAGGYNFVDGASAGFDGAMLTIPSSLTGFRQTAFGYVQDPDGGTTMCIGGILTSYSKAPCCSECGRRMHINGTITGETKHVPFGNIPVSIGFQKYLYRCPECGDCISEPVEFQADGHRITKQLQQMVEDCLAYGFNLTDTAQITGVGRNVVKSIDKARLTKQYILTTVLDNKIFLLSDAEANKYLKLRMALLFWQEVKYAIMRHTVDPGNRPISDFGAKSK